MPRKSVRAAIGALNREPMIDPSELPLQSILWRILVQPLTPLKKNHDGLIEIPDSVQEAEAIKTSVGYVVQMGHFAFKSKTQAGLALDEEPFKPKVGGYVLHEQYAGQEIKLRNGTKLRILLDTEVLAIVTDPDEIKNYI